MFRSMRTLAVPISCLVAVTGCSGSKASAEMAGQAATDAPPLSKVEDICGLTLPCAPPEIDGSHDLYGSMVAALSEHGELLVRDGSTAGCVGCADPGVFFDTLLSDPAGHKGALAHVYLSLKEAARYAFEGKEMRATNFLWDDLHVWTGELLDRTRDLGEPPPCVLLTAHCTSRTEFIEAFVTFLDEVLFRDPPDRDPGFQKEHAVKLALAANPPGGLDAIIRFIQTKAEVRARAKAVRDICAYAPHYIEAEEVLKWVVKNDDALADRARACLSELRSR
jgi:hypothetical protein